MMVLPPKQLKLNRWSMAIPAVPVAGAKAVSFVASPNDLLASAVSMPTPTYLSAAFVFKKGVPVMPCHPAKEGGVSKPLVRGTAPSTPSGDKRRMSIKKFFRVTPEEDAVILSNAAGVGLEPSSYMRLQVLGKSRVRKYRRIRADWDELRRGMGIINRAGNVVNQLVVVLRRMEVSPDLANAALKELIDAARMVMTALREL